MRPRNSETTTTSHASAGGLRLARAGATNKGCGLALCSCSMTGGGCFDRSAGRDNAKDGDGTLYRPLSCSGPSGAKHRPARLLGPKFALMQMVGGSTRFLSAASPGPLRGEPGTLVHAAQLVLDKYSQGHASPNRHGFPLNGFRLSLISENAAGERAVDCMTVSKRGRCYREERGRRKQQGRADSHRRGAGADKSTRRRHVSYGDHPWHARVVRPANLLTRQG